MTLTCQRCHIRDRPRMHRVKLRFDGILGRRPVAISNHSSPCRTQLGKELVVIPKEERAQRLSVRLDAPHRGFRLILFFLSGSPISQQQLCVYCMPYINTSMLVRDTFCYQYISVILTTHRSPSTKRNLAGVLRHTLLEFGVWWKHDLSAVTRGSM